MVDWLRRLSVGLAILLHGAAGGQETLPPLPEAPASQSAQSVPAIGSPEMPPREERWPAGEREAAPLLHSRFDDGFVVETADGQFELRLRIMEQTDFKLFVPTDQEPARSGVYIPRFRSYFEGHVTRSFEYELSLQRSVEGTFDVLDANINFHPVDELQVRIGRWIVPYSDDWFDHLEQFSWRPSVSCFR